MTSIGAGPESEEIPSGTSSAPSGAPAASAPGAHNEIERIMGEIEELQTQMASLTAVDSPSILPKAAGSPEAGVQTEPQNEPQAVLQAESQADPLKTKQPSETQELFKEIAGGEASLVAETLAGLPEPEVRKELPTSPMPAAEPKHHHHYLSPTDTEPLESESLLADRLSRAPTVNTAPTGTSDNALSMTVTGQMSLKLNFQYEGQEVWVHFNSESIRVEFSDGTEFKIPVKRARSLKKVA
jgi:hypothetical protein